MQNDSFLSEFINLMHNDREFETLFKAIEENHKENSYVKKSFKVLVTLKDILKIYRIIQF